MIAGPESVGASVDVTVGIPTYNRSRLLKRSIASVLQQTYSRFTLVVSDNASDDDTADVVASFDDSRLVYRPLQSNIGRAANTNRLIGLAETEFMVLLGDDDQLHPDHLLRTVDALNRWPTVGVAHTGCAIIDIAGNTLVQHHRFLATRDPVVFESGSQFLERSMRSGWTVCFPSATFRTEALVGGDGLRPEDGTIDDFPLLMRIATGWDFAYLNQPLAVTTAHSDASSSSLGAFTPNGYRSSRSLPDMLYERRRTFLAEADLPKVEERRLARMAERAYRRDVLRCLSMRANTGDGQGAIFRALGMEIRRDRRLALDPMTGRFLAGQLGGRRLRDGMRRVRSAAGHRS
jgi:cellulose synthase/poly-beta-1,6-N-acetylglucosamine synthase-like glycosyltransferase